MPYVVHRIHSFECPARYGMPHDPELCDYYDRDCPNCALPPRKQRTVLSDGDEIRCADCGTTLRVIDG